MLRLVQSIGDMEASVKARMESSARCEREASEMKARRDQLQNERKELWREESTIKECACCALLGFGTGSTGFTRHALRNSIQRTASNSY